MIRPNQSRLNAQAGVTLVEMMAVVAIIGLVAAISFPAVSSGLDGIRLTSATDSVAAFLNAGLNRAERRQIPIEITVSQPENSLTMRSTEPGFLRSLALPDGVSVVGVRPALYPGSEEEATRRIYFYPGGAPPAIGVEIANRRGIHRIVHIDPTSGVALVDEPLRDEDRK
ncbi:MAG: prepilin-type N-terminal cleavage/methylation domain-containing protein [Bryobacteraceae bacterium]|nr:prepilin-type N-terminal cleavage/methylation domain-containing protein [Bryobacteraceae bacterium]